jgi:hypothetical protein
MKKLFAVLLGVCLAASGAAPSSAAGGNLLAGAVVWGASAQFDADADFGGLTGGDGSAAAVSKNLDLRTALRFYFDLTPGGGAVPRNNKLQLTIGAYNAMKVSLYTAAKVYNARGTSEVQPPAASGIDGAAFNDFTRPAAVANYDPYRVSSAGAVYPETETLTFSTKQERYVCVEITTAYDSRSGAYANINNALRGAALLFGGPVSVAVSAEADFAAIPSAAAPDKTVAFSARALDEAGAPITDPSLSEVAFALAGAPAGVSIDGRAGVLTVTSAARPGAVTVTATCAHPDYTSVYGSKTITLTDVDPTEKELAEAAAALEFSMISKQRIDSVGANLSLLAARNGVLQIGGKSYGGMDVSWKSANTAVISDAGVVTRPADENKTVRLTAVLSKVNAWGALCAAEKSFDITVIRLGQPVDMRNLMKGGYGWITNGWGVASSAVDGLKTTSWNLGGHAPNTATAGLKTASGELEKYNKVVIYFYQPHMMKSYSVTGYATANDPGAASGSPFLSGSGAVSVVSYNAKNPATLPDFENKVVVKLKESAQSKYFGFTFITGSPENAQNNCGVYEFEVYYAAPNDARLADAGAKIYAPGRPETEVNDLPPLVVYDELGDELAAEFETSLALARPHSGVTLADGKLRVEYGCPETSVDLLYRSWDEDRLWLEKTLTIPVETYTPEYYEAFDAGERLKALVPAKLEANLDLPLSDGGVSIAWTSSAESYLSAAGAVNRPAYVAKDETVTLTAALTCGPYVLTRTFETLVIRQMTDEQRVIADLNRVDLGVAGSVSADVALPPAGFYGSKLTWVSNKPKIISNTGKYSRVTASKSKETVTLTATAAYNGASADKDFVVYAEAIADGSGSGGGGNGGGGGGASGGRNLSLYPNDPPEALTPLPEEAASQGVFSDVPPEHWAKTYIERLAEKGLVGGVGGGRFEPDRAVAREEFVKMVLTAFDYTLKPGKTDFSDVDADAWYGDYVVTAFKEGLVTGQSESVFGVGQNVSRQDMAVILERVLAARGADFFGAEIPFADESDISEYAAGAARRLSAIGVFGGDDAGAFRPKQSATRAEAAKTLLAAMEKGGIS